MWVMPFIDPVIVPIYGPIAIRWYGLMYAVGLGLGWLFAYRRRHRLPDDPIGVMHDLLFYGLLGGVLGGRIGYMLFYQPWQLSWDWLRVWHGGMSFHGGLLGVIIAMVWVARIRRVSFWLLADFMAPVAPLALACGRLGNLLAGELWGRVTDVPWAVVVPWLDGQPRHPSQIYECMLEGVLLFVVLWIYSSQPRPMARSSAAFLMGYAWARFIAEFFREPDAHLGFIIGEWMTQGQLLCVPMWLTGMVLWFYGPQWFKQQR